MHVRRDDDMYLFYIPTYQRFLLRHFEMPLHYIKTIGFMKYVLFLSKQYLNMIGVFSFVLSVLISSRFIFDITIIGTMPHVNQKIEKDLRKENVICFTPLKSYERLNEILTHLKTLYKNEVEYLNVYQIGSIFHIEYTKRKQDQVEKEDYRNIYASKDGMIQSLDIDSGMIKVKRNDYVKKGDLLVENTFVSTNDETKIVPVKGHVYAYTFNQFEASVQNRGQDQGDVFYQLLLMIRSQLPANVVIDKENVLQISKSHSKITLKVHYTLIEDIGTKGEENERSH